MMIFGAGLSLAGYGLLPLIRFNQLPLRSFWLLASYTLAWSGIAVFIVNTIPYLMDVTNLEERNYVFAMVGVLLALSGFVGNLVAGVLPILFATTLGLTLDQPAPYRFPLLLGAIAVIPCLLALSLTRDTGTEAQQEAEATDGRDTADPLPFELIIVLMLVILLVRTGDGAARTFFNVYLDAALHVSTALIAMMSAVVQLLAVPAALLAPLLIARLGLGRAIVYGCLGIALSLLPLALVPRWEAVGLGLAGVIVLASITVPAFTVFHQEMMPLRWRTTMSGSATLARGLGWSSIALIGGFVITNLGYRSFFLTGAGLVAAGSLLFWVYFRVPRGELAHVSGLDTTARS
jgi:predicted MFS family arabinose efflux permease